MKGFKISEELILGIVFSVFDEKIGPKAAAWIPPDLSVALKDYISFKSINLLSDERGLIPKSLAIVPFPSQKLKGLIKSLEIKDDTRRGGAIDSSITVLFSEKGDLIFYKYINNLEQIMNQAAATINKLIQSKAEKEVIEEELFNFQKSIKDLIMESFREKTKAKEAKKSLLLLFNLFQKNLDKVLYSIVMGEHVVVIGAQSLVELVIDSLTIFSFEKIPKMKYWTEEYFDADIIGGPPKIAHYYKKSLILDLEKKKISSGKSNNFCKNLINRIKNMDSINAEKELNKSLTKFYSRAKLLQDVLNKKENFNTKIDEFIKDLDFDELDFIENYLKFQVPKLESYITTIVKDCKKKMSKIISGFEKETW
ncbi:MAG: hypothetical protein EAX96_01800 [Candidatus Lokiarchaeota archaeon]|nr:hypothetical protein [Candidatus Lokiarchaeota archaeon]